MRNMRNVAYDMGGGGVKLKMGIGNSDASFLSPVKRGFFHFFCLYTTKIIAYKMLLFFICPSSTQ